MEAATTLTGQWWTDHPTGAAPVLASLARAVNDRTSQAGRAWLLPLVPWLLIDPARPGRGDAVASVLRHTARRHGLHDVDEVLGAATVSRSWRHRCRAWRARRRLITVLAAGPDGDHVVREVLCDALNAVRELDGLAPVPGLQAPIQVLRLPALVYRHAPDGSESLHYHATALLDQWPAAMIEAWMTRCAERRDLWHGPAPINHG